MVTSLVKTMKTTTILALSLSLAGTVACHPRSRPQGPQGTAGVPNLNNAKALYFLTNNAENAVVAVELDGDGLVTGRSSVTPTLGVGANGIDGATGQPAVPDALFSQSALTSVDGNIFAVNAQSNTLSMLRISQDSPLTLTPIGTPAPLPGTFPTTVTASSRLGTVCVGTTGSAAGLTCASFSPATGLGEFDALRVFDLNQSTPPVGPTNTISHAFFAGDQSSVFVTVKGDPAANKTGFLANFPVVVDSNNNNNNNQNRNRNQNGKATKRGGRGFQGGPSNSNSNTRVSGGSGVVAKEGIFSSPNGTAVLFGSAVVSSGQQQQILATDASFGAALLSVDDATGQASIVGAPAAVDNQAATCWATISPFTGTAFVTDVGRNRLVEVSFQDDVGARVVGEIDLSAFNAAKNDPGLIDLMAGGELVYALSPGNNSGNAPPAISVVNVRTRELVQHVQLAGVGANGNAMGMALHF